MHRKTSYSFLIIMLFPSSLLFGKTIDIHGVLNLEIPDEIEILSISQNLRSHKASKQYCLRTYIEIIYENAYIPLKIDLFGYGSIQELASKLGIEEIGSYYSEYRTADQKKYLKQNFIDSPEKTENIEFSRFVSEWSNGWSSDYYGIYFRMDNVFFTETIISMENVWSGFGGSNLRNNDKEFMQKAHELSSSGQRFLNLIEAMIQSIKFLPDIDKNNSLIFSSYEEIRDYYLPTIGNLRLRSKPAVDSEILGYVSEYPHLVIGVGPEFEADGIKGRWYRIRRYIGTTTGWAFSGYLRPLEEDEYIKYFEGI